MAEKLPYLARRTKSPSRERGPESIEDSRIRGVVEAARRLGAARVRMGLRANALDMWMRQAHEPLNRNHNRLVGGEPHNGLGVGLQRSSSHPRDDHKDVSRFVKDWLWHLQGRLKTFDASMTFAPATSDDSKDILKTSNSKTGFSAGQLSLASITNRGRRIGTISSSELLSFERSTRSVPGAAASKTTRSSLNRQPGANGLSRSVESVRIRPDLTRDRRVIHQLGEIGRGLDLKAERLRPDSGSKPSIIVKTADRTRLALRSSIQTGFKGEASSRSGFAALTSRSERLSVGGVGQNFSERGDGRIAPGVNYDPSLLSRRLERSMSDANSLRHSREQHTGSRALAELTTNRGSAGGARRLTSDQPAQPIVVNFSPTIVIHSGEGFADIETAVLRAVRQHSHELVRVIGRELQTQRRAAF